MIHSDRRQQNYWRCTISQYIDRYCQCHSHLHSNFIIWLSRLYSVNYAALTLLVGILPEKYCLNNLRFLLRGCWKLTLVCTNSGPIKQKRRVVNSYRYLPFTSDVDFLSRLLYQRNLAPTATLFTSLIKHFAITNPFVSQNCLTFRKYFYWCAL